ncbi:MAG TPA: branched-chain amino acid aminotransferase [Bacillales bacterium]
MANEIDIKLGMVRKSKPDPDRLGFGKYFSDHMFIMDYEAEKGWYHPRIVPYQPITLDPSARVLHYGQAVFEGLKAYRTKEGRALLFRPEKNMRRLNLSNERLCIPPLDEGFLIEALKQLIAIDKDWIPSADGTSLYIRPFIISTDSVIGASAANQYRFMIILSPVGSYYKEGMHPIRIHVESKYVRAVDGGIGAAKTAGNYASALKAQKKAQDNGYAQVLWLDGIERKYVEEVGNMNVFFKLNGEVVTPLLNGSILAGITRDSVIHLLRDMNVPVTERKISIEELYKAHADGTFEEAFGAGTAAVISPIGELNWRNEKIQINNGKTGKLAKRLYDTLTGIQQGHSNDPYGWTVEVKPDDDRS